MSALEDLKLKANKDYTSLEAAIVYLSGTYYADAENAAAELERMTAVIEALKKLETKYNSEEVRNFVFVSPHDVAKDISAALAELDKVAK